MSEGRTPVVLVHGLRASRTMWRAQVTALEAAGRTVVAPDLPGHGARLGERYTHAGAVDAVAAAVQDVGGRAVVVGLSLGGYVAIAHAARHPEQVAGLVAASCSTRPHRAVLRAWGAAAWGFARLPDRGAAVNQWLVDRTLPAEGAADAGAGGFALDVVEDALREMTVARPLEDLGRVPAPVWIVNGRWDHFRGEERRFLAACRDGRLVVVPRATHLVSLVQPVRFTRVLLEVLADVDAREALARTGRS
ncbi:alpha/beta fold hydrolase [Cellulomonas sp. JZ18]|uniref:alpha/beta fold hydrolase n=1 Tax=Cellulomonas sp. JZ18 TaxID=2654191 RepID=UPI0012D3EA3D|nr:alpha/beta hydrolase [Cellulomonas sp. JZ18]QGQ18686.1 alpha/beta fold hydrolase [Cellulomonas sp. JZ18]